MGNAGATQGGQLDLYTSPKSEEYIKERNAIEKNITDLENLKKEIERKGIGYNKAKADMRYYNKDLTNYFFTGGENEPEIDTKTGKNNTIFYTKPEVNMFFTGKKDGELLPGPYASRSYIDEYYIKAQADANILTKSRLANYYKKEDADKLIVSKKPSASDTLIQIAGHRACHFQLVDASLRLIGGTNRWCSDLGSFAIETNKVTNRRRFFGYITNSGNFLQRVGTKTFMQIMYSNHRNVFDINKPLSANVRCMGDSGTICNAYIRFVDSKKIIIGNVLSTPNNTTQMIMVDVVGYSGG